MAVPAEISTKKAMISHLRCVITSRKCSKDGPSLAALIAVTFPVSLELPALVISEVLFPQCRVNNLLVTPGQKKKSYRKTPLNQLAEYKPESWLLNRPKVTFCA
jgi:hypothetical protein